MKFQPVLKTLTTSVLFAMACISGVHAQTESAAVGSNTLINSINKGLENSPRLDSEIHALEAMMEEANVSFSFMLPTVDIRGSTGRERIKINEGDSRSYNANSYGIEARQNLFNGFASQARYLSSYSEAMSQYYKVLDVANQITKEAAVAHLKVAKFQHLTELAEQHVKYHQDLMARIEEKVGQGVSRSADLEQARSRYTLALSNLATEKANTFSAMAEYQRVTDSIWPINDKGNHVIETNFEVENTERILHALNNHYLLKSSNAKLYAAKHSVTVAEEGFYPRLDLRAKSDMYSNYLSTFDERQISSVDLLASMNLFRGGADKASQAAAIKRKYQSFDRKLIVCKAIRQSTQTALYDVVNLQKKLGYFKQQADSIGNARSAYEQQYQIGRRTLLDLLNAENEYYQAKRNLISIETDLSESKLNLLASTGQLIELFNVENLIGADEPTKRKVLLYKDQISTTDDDSSCPAELLSLNNFNLPTIGFDPGLKSVNNEFIPANRNDSGANVEPAEPTTGVDSPSVNNTGAAKPILVAQANIPGVGDKMVKFTDPAKVSNKLIEHTKAWAIAWEARDINQYVRFYASDFKPEDGSSYDFWLTQRRNRISTSREIEVKLTEIQVIPSFDEPDVFETTFIQSFKSKNYRERSRKILTWKAKENGSWQIIREQNLPENTVMKQSKSDLAMDTSPKQ